MKEQTEKNIMTILFLFIIAIILWAFFCPAASAQDINSATKAFRIILSEPCVAAPNLRFADSVGSLCPVSKAEEISPTEYRIVLIMQWVDATGTPRKAANGWGKFSLIEPLEDLTGNTGSVIASGRSWRVLLPPPRVLEIKEEPEPSGGEAFAPKVKWYIESRDLAINNKLLNLCMED